MITPSHEFFSAWNKLVIHWFLKYVIMQLNELFSASSKLIAPQMLWSEKYMITPSHEFFSALNKLATHLLRFDKRMIFKYNDCMHVKKYVI